MEAHRRHFMASAAGLAAFAAIRANARPVVAPRHRERGVYAEKGEKTYCANGCEIGHFGNTVNVGVEPKLGDLVPVEGMSVGMSECPFCTAPVVGWPGEYYFAT